MHASHRVDQANEPYKAGDIIGCLINFQSDELEDIESDHPADDSAFPKDPKKPQGNYVRYFRNGRDQGVAFEQHPAGALPRGGVGLPHGHVPPLGPRWCWPMPPASRCAAAGGGADGEARLRVGAAPRHAARGPPSRRSAGRARIEQARAEAEEKKAAEVKAQKDALKNARRNARRAGRELGWFIIALALASRRIGLPQWPHVSPELDDGRRHLFRELRELRAR